MSENAFDDARAMRESKLATAAQASQLEHSQPMELEVRFPFWVAYRANLEMVRWSAFQMLMSSLFPLAGVYLCYLWYTHDHAVTVADVLLVLGCFLFTPLITLLVLFLGRRKNPLSAGPFRYRFDAEGIRTSGAAFDMSLKWSAIRKVRESRYFIFFFVSPSHAHTIPVSQLRAAGLLDQVRSFAKQKVTDAQLAAREG